MKRELTDNERKDNLVKLKKILDNENFENYITEECWGGADVMITSDPNRVFNPETDEDDWFGRRSSTTYVLTKNANALSGLIFYVKDNIMKYYGKDLFLYDLIALFANNYIEKVGDYDDYYPLLRYLYKGIEEYCYLFYWPHDKKSTKYKRSSTHDETKDFMKFLKEFMDDDENLK